MHCVVQYILHEIFRATFCCTDVQVLEGENREEKELSVQGSHVWMNSNCILSLQHALSLTIPLDFLSPMSRGILGALVLFREKQIICLIQM